MGKTGKCSFFVLSGHGRNFGLKSGGTNSEGERGALGSRGERGGEYGGRISPHQLWGLGERCELSQQCLGLGV